MILLAPRFVGALDRGHLARSSPPSSRGIREDHVAILINSRFEP
jgi:hypothetical protein